VAALAFLLRASSAQTDSPPNGHPARLIAAGLVVFALPWTTLPLRVALLAHRTPHGPNIIVISADTLRVDQVGCFGQTDDLTPNLDRFAQDAVRFTQAVSSSSWTLPAHATLFTGLRPSRTETWTAFSPVPWRFDTLAEILREAGYHTVAFTGGGVMGRFFRFDQGFDLYWTVPASQGISFNPRESRTITRQAMHWLSKQDGRPFFLFLHTYQTHCPYWKQEGPGPAEAVYCPCTRNQPERQRPECLATYQGNVRFLDDQLGVFFQNLKDRGLYDDAMIVFMSDHGESFLQDQRPIVEHAFLLTEELIHVPLMVKLPRNRQAGAVRDVQVRMMDIFPTVLEIAGLAARRVDGVTLTPVIDGGEQGHRQAVAEFQPMVLAEGTPIQHAMNVPRLALRQPDHKLVRQFAPDKTEFFDLRADPHELADLLANAAWKPTPAYERMQAALTLFDFVPLPSPSAGAGQTLTREAEEQLKGLGYLH
jgi:arylsulfatase A-like enzyme